jgi:uncharacterized protein YdeI (YjbR/CyaY-like superfamily)
MRIVENSRLASTRRAPASLASPATSYSIRFTPRKRGSIWSSVNIRRVGELAALGLMQPAGIAAFEARTEKRSRIYSFEQSDVRFEPAQERQFQANAAAWEFFQAQAPSYRKTVTWRIISAKLSATRQKRLAELILRSAQRQRVL